MDNSGIPHDGDTTNDYVFILTPPFPMRTEDLEGSMKRRMKAPPIGTRASTAKNSLTHEAQIQEVFISFRDVVLEGYVWKGLKYYNHYNYPLQLSLRSPPALEEGFACREHVYDLDKASSCILEFRFEPKKLGRFETFALFDISCNGHQLKVNLTGKCVEAEKATKKKRRKKVTLVKKNTAVANKESAVVKKAAAWVKEGSSVVREDSAVSKENDTKVTEAVNRKRPAEVMEDPSTPQRIKRRCQARRALFSSPLDSKTLCDNWLNTLPENAPSLPKKVESSLVGHPKPSGHAEL